MTLDDLPAVARWLREPHVARWWTPETTPEAEIDEFRARVDAPDGATRMCSVDLGGRPIGWCQWYRWADDPDDAGAIGALASEIGADYAIGEPAQIGRGVGTAMIAALVAHVRTHHPGAGLLVAPEAANGPSRRVLEKYGFSLVEVRPVAAEPHARPIALYRLPPAGGC